MEPQNVNAPVITPSNTDSSQAYVNSPNTAVSQSDISSVKVERGPITVDMVRASLKTDPDGKPNRETAQLRQLTKRHYPSGKVGNNMQDSLFDAEDFKFVDRVAESIRMAFVDVPLGTTREKVEAMLAANPDACIYQVLSDKPILTDSQIQAVAAGLTTVADIAFGKPDANGVRNGGQVVRYGNSTNIPEGKGPNDMVLSPSGNIQFRQTYFSRTFRPDLDTRKRVPSSTATSFTSDQASNLVRSVATPDQMQHEGGPTTTGQNPNAAYRAQQGIVQNDFKGTVSQGEMRTGEHPFGKPAAQAGFEDNPDIISDDDARRAAGEETFDDEGNPTTEG